MIQTVIYHKVENYDKWKKAFEKFSDMRKKHGEVSYSVGRETKDPSNVFVINEWKTMDGFNNFMNSHDLKEAMKEAGVVEEPHIAVLNEETKGML